MAISDSAVKHTSTFIVDGCNGFVLLLACGVENLESNLLILKEYCFRDKCRPQGRFGMLFKLIVGKSEKDAALSDSRISDHHRFEMQRSLHQIYISFYVLVENIQFNHSFTLLQTYPICLLTNSHFPLTLPDSFVHQLKAEIHVFDLPLYFRVNRDLLCFVGFDFLPETFEGWRTGAHHLHILQGDALVELLQIVAKVLLNDGELVGNCGQGFQVFLCLRTNYLQEVLVLLEVFHLTQPLSHREGILWLLGDGLDCVDIALVRFPSFIGEKRQAFMIIMRDILGKVHSVILARCNGIEDPLLFGVAVFLEHILLRIEIIIFENPKINTLQSKHFAKGLPIGWVFQIQFGTFLFINNFGRRKMNHKYQQNNLLYMLCRKDELERLRKKIQEIKSRKPIMGQHNSSMIHLPKIHSPRSLSPAQQRIEKENNRLKIRIEELKKDRYSEYSYRQISKQRSTMSPSLKKRNLPSLR